MTLPLTITALALWSVVMYRYGRSVLFPPAALALVWTLTLFAIYLCGDLYFPLTVTADEIVLAGVLAFSAGGVCAVAAPLWQGRTLTSVTDRRRSQIDRWLTGAMIAFLLNIPLSYLYFKQLSATIAPRPVYVVASQRHHRAAGKSVAANPHCGLETQHLPPGHALVRIHHPAVSQHHRAHQRL